MIKTINKRIVASSLLLLVLGLIDYFTSYEIGTSVFYIIPILVFSYQDELAIKYSVAFSLFSLLIWGGLEYATHPYSDSLFMPFNFVTKGLLFVGAAVGASSFFIEKKQKMVISSQKIELEEANKDLQIANAKLNRIIGVAAHDIRNPVSSIQTMAEVLMEEKMIAEETRDLIGLIQASAKNSLQILNDTLNISHIQSGTIQLNASSSNYIEFVNECLAMNNPMALRKKQSIQFISAIPELTFTFDRSRLSQVMSNLITNAIKYSEQQTDITVKVAFADPEKNSVLTEIIDKGPGIEEKYRTTIFDPFTTTSNKPTGNESKTGLGLAIAKRIVELHNGTIGFLSEKGKGTVFYFTLPVK